MSRQKNLFNADLSEAMAVLLCLWEKVNVKLCLKLLRRLGPRDRVVAPASK